MKMLLTLSLLTLMTAVHARPCKVYGISDSPQKLTCQFGDDSLALRCLKGRYYLNRVPVRLAYHLDVEEGSVPLVFKTTDSVLTVLIRPKVDIEAELETRARLLQGTCI